MDQKRFSATTVFLTALISFLVSGLGGSAISEWLARPKPLVTVSSVGFVGSQNQVPIDDSVIKSTEENPWMRTYRKFESFGSMALDYEKVDRIKKRLEGGLALADSWLKRNQSKLVDTNARLTLSELAGTPYCKGTIARNNASIYETPDQS